MPTSTEILLVYSGFVGLDLATVVWEVRRGRAKWRALWSVAALALVFGMLLFPMFSLHLQMESVTRWNREHPEGPRRYYE